MHFHKPGLQYTLRNSCYVITVLKKLLNNNHFSHCCSTTFTRVSDAPAELSWRLNDSYIKISVATVKIHASRAQEPISSTRCVSHIKIYN